MKTTSQNKKQRQRVSAENSRGSNQSDENSCHKLIPNKCSSRSSFLNKYEKQIMQRSYSSDKKQSHRRKAEASTKESLETRRSRARSKVPNLKAKSPIESDSFYHYATPSPKPSVENIPKATLYQYSSQDDDHDKEFKDSDDESKYLRDTPVKYYRNIDDNLNYNRFNPSHNIHKNLSIYKKHPSVIRNRTGSNNLLSIREYNKMLNNDSQNSYGYFHGDKNNKLCYISNRPVYYDNSSISETMKYRQKYNELSIKNNSEFKMTSKSDTSIAPTPKYCQNYQSDGNNKNIEKVEKYLSTMERSNRNSHHNEKSILDINPNMPANGRAVIAKNSEITRLTNEIAQKLQNIGLNIHSTVEPLPRSKRERKKEDNSENGSGKNQSPKKPTSKDSDGAENPVNAPMPCPREDDTKMETGAKKSADPPRTSKAPKYKQHSKYHLSNAENNDDNCLCHDSFSAKQNDRNICCYREGEHMNLKQDHANLKQELLNCYDPRADGRNIYENLDVCDIQHVYKQSEEHSKLIAHNLTKLPSCSCAFREMKCECGPDVFAKYGLYKNSKRSRSPLTAVNKKTNGVYVFVPLPENSNDPLEMSKHLQNIYTNIIPMNDKHDKQEKQDKSNEKPSATNEVGETNATQKAQGTPKVPETEKPEETASRNSNDNKENSKSEAPETDSETAKVKLINQLLDEYNLSLIKQLIRKKSPLKSIISRDDIAEELKKFRQQSVSRRHSDLNLHLDQIGKSSLRPKKCPSDSSFAMKLTDKTGSNLNENDKHHYYSDGQFRTSSPDYSPAFQKLQQQHPMLFDQNRESLNNYQSINLPFQEFVSDLAKYRPAPQGTGQALFYTRNKSPKSYHGQPLPPPQPAVFDSAKPGHPLASSIIDPTIPFQSKVNSEAMRDSSAIYSRPKSPSQTFNYGLDGRTKKTHQQLMHHAHHQTHPKQPFDPAPEPVTYSKVQNIPSFYPSGDVTYSMPTHKHVGLYDIEESVEYSPPRYDYSPTRYERHAIYNHADYDHQHKSLKSQYYKTMIEPPGYSYDFPAAQTCHNHSFSQPYYKPADHYHGDRMQFVDFRDQVHLIESDHQPKQPSILKKLQDVVAKPFSLLFKVEASDPLQNRSHLKGILKPTIDVDEDEPNDYFYYKKCGGNSYDKSHSRNTSNYDEEDLDSISQPPLEYVTVVDPYQTDSFESLHDDEKRYVDTSTGRNGHTSHNS